MCWLWVACLFCWLFLARRFLFKSSTVFSAGFASCQRSGASRRTWPSAPRLFFSNCCVAGFGFPNSGSGVELGIFFQGSQQKSPFGDVLNVAFLALSIPWWGRCLKGRYREPDFFFFRILSWWLGSDGKSGYQKGPLLWTSLQETLSWWGLVVWIWISEPASWGANGKTIPPSQRFFFSRIWTAGSNVLGSISLGTLVLTTTAASWKYPCPRFPGSRSHPAWLSFGSRHPTERRK